MFCNAFKGVKSLTSIFPSNESAYHHNQQTIQYHTKARDKHLHLAQIIHRAAIHQGQPVNLGPQINHCSCCQILISSLENQWKRNIYKHLTFLMLSIVKVFQAIGAVELRHMRIFHHPTHATHSICSYNESDINKGCSSFFCQTVS
jgi:hypothetical protein